MPATSALVGAMQHALILSRERSQKSGAVGTAIPVLLTVTVQFASRSNVLQRCTSGRGRETRKKIETRAKNEIEQGRPYNGDEPALLPSRALEIQRRNVEHLSYPRQHRTHHLRQYSRGKMSRSTSTNRGLYPTSLSLKTSLQQKPMPDSADKPRHGGASPPSHRPYIPTAHKSTQSHLHHLQVSCIPTPSFARPPTASTQPRRSLRRATLPRLPALSPRAPLTLPTRSMRTPTSACPSHSCTLWVHRWTSPSMRELLVTRDALPGVGVVQMQC